MNLLPLLSRGAGFTWWMWEPAGESEQRSGREFFVGAECCKKPHGLFFFPTRRNCSVLEDINFYSYR